MQGRLIVGVVPVGVNLRALPLRGVLSLLLLLKSNKILILHYKLQVTALDLLFSGVTITAMLQKLELNM